ncbi:Uncharacterised protein [Klebsiella variicola]|uniref:MarR family transcriptional regulator n=1 Tax=Klebsiella variicola TaxID=244366 RepID=UPI000E2CC9C3|nr:MarR family transcriptional regulator [Klebsiella variicola]SXG02987.1 Uncharacterised protein [Klebsiella variicola]
MNLLVMEALKFVSSMFMLEALPETDISEELPFQLKKSTTLCLVKIEGGDFLMLATDDTDTLLSNNALHLRRVADKYESPLIIVTSEGSPELRKWAKVVQCGLIVPWRYSILPSLLIHSDVAEIPRASVRVDTEKPYGIIPSYLICYYFAGYFSHGFNSGDLMDILGVSKMAVSRAVKEMVGNNLIQPEGHGRSVQYHFTNTRKGLWHNQRHRISPLSTGSVPVRQHHLPPAELFRCGESALSKYTLLSPPSKPSLGLCMSNDDRYMRPINSATIDGDYFFKIMKVISDNPSHELSADYDATLQIFPYKPLITDGFVDSVFLAFTRMNKHEIRVKSAFLDLETSIYNNLNG